MYIHKLSDDQIKELMKCYAPDYTDIDILKRPDLIQVSLIVNNTIETYVLYDFTVKVCDRDDSETDCLHKYRTKMREYFGNRYAIDYLLRWKDQPTVLIVGGEHSQFKKAMKDYICDNDENKPTVIVNQCADKIENVDYVEDLGI